MRYEFNVHVRDATGAPIKDAEVALVPASKVPAGTDPVGSSVAKTHAHDAQGLYKHGGTAPVAGPWALFVRKKDLCPVFQRLELTEPKPQEFAWKALPAFAATVSARTEKVAVKGKDAVLRLTLGVTLHPASEVVFISGTEYEGRGTNFDLFARGRREQLWQSKKISPGTLVTAFSCNQRTRTRWVRGGAKGPAWIEIDTWKPKPGDTTPPIDTRSAGYKPDRAIDVSIVHFYEYLSDVGANRPGTVKEAAIFSHSWHGGPILFSTRDTMAATRDPNDLDARAKDFDPANVAGWPNLRQAFATDGSYHVRGCLAVVHMKAQARAAQAHRKSPAGVFFRVASDYVHPHPPPPPLYKAETIEITDLARVRATIDASLRRGYLMAAGAFFSVPVWGAPPGIGASFLRKDGVDTMQVDGADKQVLAYYREELGAQYEANEGNYLNFTKIAARPPIPAPPFSYRYAVFEQSWRPSKQKLKLTAQNGKHFELPAYGFAHAYARKAGLVTPGVDGVLHTLTKAGHPPVYLYIEERGGMYAMVKSGPSYSVDQVL